MNPLQAWKDARVTVDFIDCEEMTITFSNGVTLPVHAFYDAAGRHVEEPVEPGYAEFGDEEHGYGTYKVKIISEEEYEDALENAQAKENDGSRGA